MPGFDASKMKLISTVPALPSRKEDGNKGDFGKVLVVGGSRGMSGAPCMAARAAYRSGAGLVRVAIPLSIWDIVAFKIDECLTDGLAETRAGTLSGKALGRLQEISEWCDVVVMGPGMSQQKETSGTIQKFVTKLNQALVLDADGLNAFEGHTNDLNGKGRVLVITPHPGEMARLCNCSVADVQRDRLGSARKFARDHELTVVLKGHRTLVVQPDGEAWVNTTGNPGMSTGGTGDILTGMVASMLAQEKRAQNAQTAMLAVLAAVYLHGLAGDGAKFREGEMSLVATDLLTSLPTALFGAQAIAKQRVVSWEH